MYVEVFESQCPPLYIDPQNVTAPSIFQIKLNIKTINPIHPTQIIDISLLSLLIDNEQVV
jgi:hypothetical protein